MERIAVIMGKMHSGGKKNLVMEYYRNIDRSKVQFDFICDSDSNSIPEEEIINMGGRVYIVAPYQNIVKNLKGIRKILKENKYRIIHGYNGTMNVFAMFTAWTVGVPIRINESISMGHRSDKKTILKNMLKPFSRCFATHYMANGEECGRWQFGKRLYNKGKVKVFKTVINTEVNEFKPEVREATRHEYGLEEKFVVGHIGRLTEQKNTLFLIDIFAEICKKNADAILLLIGDGNLKEAMLEKIEKLGIEKSVMYLGRREDIQQFYNAMDCFLLPSLYEGLPVVGVEAQCCGLPVFFSEEIPRESSACADLGYFIGLDKSAQEWADVILEKIKGIQRRNCREEVKKAGFDSVEEAKKLVEHYKKL